MRKIWLVIKNNLKQFLMVILFNLLLIFILVFFEIGILTEISIRQFFVVVFLTLYTVVYIGIVKDTIDNFKLKMEVYNEDEE